MVTLNVLSKLLPKWYHRRYKWNFCLNRPLPTSEGGVSCLCLQARARTSWYSTGNTAPVKTPSTLKKALCSNSHKSLQPVSHAETSAQIWHFKILFGGWRKVSERAHRSSGRARVLFHCTYIQRKTNQNSRHDNIRCGSSTRETHTGSQRLSGHPSHPTGECQVQWRHCIKIEVWKTIE